MRLIEETIFYKKAKKMLDDYVRAGGKIEDLTTKDKEYKYIKDAKVFDENGIKIELEKRFELLGYPRSLKKSKTVRDDLIAEIQEYLKNGGSFHINRKKLPFYEKLLTYSKFLRRQGIVLTHEQIMKEDLGFREFSDDYYRCKQLFKIDQYTDKNGYVDDLKKDKVLATIIKDLGRTYKVPYYFIIIFLADKELKKYIITIDKIQYTQRLLQNYATKNKTFVGLRRKDPYLFEMFEYLTKYYSDGSGQTFSKQEWLQIFGLSDVENLFKDTTQEEIDIDNIIFNIKTKNSSGFICTTDLDWADYSKIIHKSISMGVSVEGLLNSYGIKCKGSSIARLTRVYVDEVPYLKEMKEMFNKLVFESGKTKENGTCKEEILEAKIKAMQQVYAEFEEKLDSYLPEEFVEEEKTSSFTDTI